MVVKPHKRHKKITILKVLGVAVLVFVGLALIGQHYNAQYPSTWPVRRAFGAQFYYVSGQQYVTSATGASVRFTQASPYVNGSGANNHSLIELAVESKDDKQIVEIGWIVAPNMVDATPRLFTFHWVNGNQTCYDGCGFVQTSTTVVPGEPVQVGSAGTYKINYADGVWNLYYNDAKLGYYPESLWNGSFTQIGHIQVFGEVEVDNASTSHCIQMGNSISGSKPGSARISDFSLIGSKAKPHLHPVVTAPSTYASGFASATGLNLGGPGDCRPDES